MLDKAVQWDLLAKNPMAKVDRPTVKRPKVKYLTEERAVELLRCLKAEPNLCYRSALLLALLCGLRLGEVGALRLTDVDFDTGTIDISRALKYTPQTGNYEGSPKTESGNRLVALPPGMLALLHETREYQQDVAGWAGAQWVGEGWIVHVWNGARVHHDTPSKWFRRFADAHGFEGVRFHDLRHTHATILLASNIDAVAVATRLGHRNATTTLQVYAHALRRRDEDAARAVQSLLDRAADPADK
jgi:integrase